jgi:hypothetical protein
MKCPFKRVEIVWDDAETTALGWEHKDEVTTPPRLACTLGWLILENADYVVVAHSADADGNTNGRIQIPIKMIKERHEVKPHAPRRKPSQQTNDLPGHT